MSLPERGLLSAACRRREPGVLPLMDVTWIVLYLFSSQCLTWFLHYHVNKMDVANGDEESRSESSNGSLATSPTNKTDINPAEYYERRLGDLAPFIPVRSRAEQEVGSLIFMCSGVSQMKHLDFELANPTKALTP